MLPHEETRVCDVGTAETRTQNLLRLSQSLLPGPLRQSFELLASSPAADRVSRVLANQIALSVPVQEHRDIKYDWGSAGLLEGPAGLLCAVAAADVGVVADIDPAPGEGCQILGDAPGAACERVRRQPDCAGRQAVGLAFDQPDLVVAPAEFRKDSELGAPRVQLSGIAIRRPLLDVDELAALANRKGISPAVPADLVPD